MAAIKLILKIDGPHVINDLGLTIDGVIGDVYNLIDERAEDVSTSTDLQDAVVAGAFVVLDPRDPAEIIELSAAESADVLLNHNQVHWGVVGGRFAGLDDPNTVLTQDHVVTIGPSGTAAVAQPLSTVLAATDNSEAIQDIVGDMLSDEADISYDDATGKLDLEDSFLRNDGDTLDTGTLTVASGAAIDIAAGGSLTVQDAPTDPKDVANKEYVDALANGMDHKESVQAASTTDVGFTFTDNGGAGDTLEAPAAGETIVDGVTLEDGDRILIKDQADPTQNGIYVVSGAGAGDPTVLTRAEDQDGSSSNEISAGNTTFVEGGTTNGSTGWIVTGDGELTVNTDDINWTQNSGQGTYSGANGVALNGTEFSVTTSNVTPAAGTVEATDELIIGDASDGGNTAKITIGDALDDLDVVSGISGNGFAVRTADDTYTNRVIAVEPAGDLGGLVIDNGDGVAGDPIIGLDIQNTASNDAVDNNDLVIVYDVTAQENRTYTIAEIANSASSDTFKTWTGAGNTTGDASVVAVGGSDEVTITGDAGVNIDLDSATQTVTFSMTGNGLTSSTGVAGTDEIVVFNPTTGAPESITLDALVDDLDLVTSVSASTVAGQEGIVIDDTDPAAPIVGLDIDGLTDSTDNLAAADEFVMNDGTNNVSVSGQQLADGVADILGLPEITASVINGQPVVTVTDSTRGDKQLSIDSNSYLWSENSLGNNDWVQIAGAGDADSGYIMPLDGTIVMATAHCENANNASTINIYNGASTTPVAAAGSFTASANAQFVNTTLNLDVAQGDRIRLRNVGGQIQDTVITLYIKWRA